MDELQILKNFIHMMPKTYRKRHANWVIVHDILLAGTSTAGCTSCRQKCIDLGINPDKYTID
jgi:hypothetical protein